MENNNIILMYDNEVIYVYVNRKRMGIFYEQWDFEDVLNKILQNLNNKGKNHLCSINLEDIYFDDIEEYFDIDNQDIRELFTDSEYITELEEYAIINNNLDYLQALILERLFITGG